MAESRLSVAVTHGERLLAAIDGMLREARWRAGRRGRAGRGAWARGRSPASGSASSTMKGLAFATGKPLVGIPTLDALAWTLPFAAYPVCPILDAKKGEVYTALYRTREGRLEPAVPLPGRRAPDAGGRAPPGSRGGPWCSWATAWRPSPRSWSAPSGRRRGWGPPPAGCPRRSAVGTWPSRRWAGVSRRTRPSWCRSTSAGRRQSSRASARGPAGHRALSRCGSRTSTRCSPSSGSRSPTPWSRHAFLHELRENRVANLLGGARR